MIVVFGKVLMETTSYRGSQYECLNACGNTNVHLMHLYRLPLGSVRAVEEDVSDAGTVTIEEGPFEEKGTQRFQFNLSIYR